MSENVEFISAADLPTTDAEEIDVLCVENGELKRKPAANLGGNGGNGGVFMLKTTLDDFVPDETGGGPPMCTIDYDELVKALEMGIPCTIVLPAGFYGEGSPPASFLILSWACSPDEGLWICTWDVNLLFPNGTYVPNLE